LDKEQIHIHSRERILRVLGGKGSENLPMLSSFNPREITSVQPAMTIAEQLRSRKKALTVEELADVLCIAIRTVYKEVEDNHIPFFRVRSSIRFDPHQVADWLDGKMPSYSVRPPESERRVLSRRAV